MKLYRNLFYILLVVFITSLLLIILIDSSSIISRIATGMLTGAFIGGLTTFVNFVHSRHAFLKQLIPTLLTLSVELESDYNIAILRNNDIEKKSKKDILSKYSQLTGDGDKMRERYQKLEDQIDFKSYSELLPLYNKVHSIIESIGSILHLDIDQIVLVHQFCYRFDIAFEKDNKKSQSPVPFDPEFFYNTWIQCNKDYQEMIAYTLYRIGFLCDSLSKALNNTLSASYLNVLSAIHINILQTIEDTPIHDVSEIAIDRIIQAYGFQNISYQEKGS